MYIVLFLMLIILFLCRFLKALHPPPPSRGLRSRRQGHVKKWHAQLFWPKNSHSPPTNSSQSNLIMKNGGSLFGTIATYDRYATTKRRQKPSCKIEKKNDWPIMACNNACRCQKAIQQTNWCDIMCVETVVSYCDKLLAKRAPLLSLITAIVYIIERKLLSLELFVNHPFRYHKQLLLLKYS